MGQSAQRLGNRAGSLWTDKSKFKIFGSNRKVYVRWRVYERAADPSIAPSIKHRGGSAVVWGAFLHCQVRDLYQLKSKLNQTSSHSILQDHAIPSGIWLVGQWFALIQNNDPKQTTQLCSRYTESKEEQRVLQLMSKPAQSVDLIPLNWCGMNLIKKSELNNPPVLLNSGNSAGKFFLFCLFLMWHRKTCS